MDTEQRDAILDLRQRRVADSEDVTSPEAIVRALYDSISGPAEEERERNWDRVRSLFLPDAQLVLVRWQTPSGEEEQILRAWNVECFIEASKYFYRESSFFEEEISHSLERFGHIAHVFSTYAAHVKEGDETPVMRGINSIQLVKEEKAMTRMRWFWVGLASSFLLVGCSGSDGSEGRASGPGRATAIPDSVQDELVRLGLEDQRIRQDLSPERMQDTVFAKALLRGDSARTGRLRAIVEEYGWPDPARVGEEAAGAAFLILQHSPADEFQQQMLPVLEDLAARGEVPRSETAMLVDRVLMRQDLPQRYGTQFKMIEGRWVLHPIEAEAQLEERRLEMGLPSMEEYMALLEEYTNTPVVREW